MQIAPDLLQQVVDHAKREAPYECCGYLVLDADRVVVEVVEAENLAHSPLRFQMDGKSELAMGLAMLDDVPVVLYHSHTRSEPRPSQTDMNYAANLLGVEWLIIGLARGELDIRNWRIEDGRAEQVDIEVRVDAGV
jgi:[CysO sulfur-carrier protein]-S-L-cysteine hydrolase